MYKISQYRIELDLHKTVVLFSCIIRNTVVLSRDKSLRKVIQVIHSYHEVIHKFSLMKGEICLLEFYAEKLDSKLFSVDKINQPQ